MSGVHGSGKTTVYNTLRDVHCRESNWIFMPERTCRPPYPFGSRDPQIAFRAELWYLRQMIERNEVIRNVNGNGMVVVCDRSPICVLAYSHALCTPDDHKIIKELYSSVRWDEDTVFYLEMTSNTTASRLRSRRRRNLKKWNEDDETYILRVMEGYEKAFRYVSQGKNPPELIRIPNDDAKPRDTIQQITTRIFAK